MQRPHPFNVVLAKPPAFVHYQAYADLAKMLTLALRRLGHPTRLVVNEFVRDATNIVIGAHNVDAGMAAALPPDTIVCNTEQMHQGSPFVEALLPFAQRFVVWDYTEANLAHWQRVAPGARVHALRMGYLPEMAVALAVPRDVDVLFLGLVNPRRRQLLDRLKAAGVAVRELANVYGEERTLALARAKLLLNIHVDRDSPFEILRAMLAFTHRCALVTEQGGLSPGDDDLREGMLVVPADELAEKCRMLLAEPARCDALGERGDVVFRRRDFVGTVRGLLEARDAHAAGARGSR